MIIVDHSLISDLFSTSKKKKHREIWQRCPWKMQRCGWALPLGRHPQYWGADIPTLQAESLCSGRRMAEGSVPKGQWRPGLPGGDSWQKRAHDTDIPYGGFPEMGVPPNYRWIFPCKSLIIHNWGGSHILGNLHILLTFHTGTGTKKRKEPLCLAVKWCQLRLQDSDEVQRAAAELLRSEKKLMKTALESGLFGTYWTKWRGLLKYIIIQYYTVSIHMIHID